MKVVFSTPKIDPNTYLRDLKYGDCVRKYKGGKQVFMYIKTTQKYVSIRKEYTVGNPRSTCHKLINLETGEITCWELNNPVFPVNASIQVEVRH